MVQKEQFRSLRELFEAVKDDADLNKHRDYIADSRNFLNLLGLGKEKRDRTYLQEPIPDLPTLLVAPHYIRPLRQRSWRMPADFLGTTSEAMKVTAILTEELSELSKRRIAWFVKNDFSRLSASLGNKDMQLAAVKCYGQIPVSGENVLAACRQARESLDSGLNVGLYPEGKVRGRLVQLGLRNYRFGDYDDFFKVVLAYLGKKKTLYQILPASIYFSEGIFHTVLGKLINPIGDSKDLAIKAMDQINDHLPADLQRIKSKKSFPIPLPWWGRRG